MALLTPTAVPGSAATAIPFGSAQLAGDTIAYKKDRLQIIIFKKGAASADVTIAAARTSVQAGRDVAALSDLTFTLGANTSRAFVITPAYVASTGLVTVTYTAVSQLTVAVLEL